MNKPSIPIIITTIVGIISIIVVIFFPTIYDCSGLEEQVSSSLNTCFQEETKLAELEKNKEIQQEINDLNKLKEDNRHCEQLVSLGKICDKMNLSSYSNKLIRRKPSCSQQAKETICKPKMFLWKLWFL